MIASRSLRLTISEAWDGQRADKALAALALAQEPALSRARLQALLAEGRVTRNGAAFSDASHKVKTDEVYTITLPPPEKAEPEAQKIALTIIHEDKDVIDDKAVMLPRAGIVHRLDKDTSGLMIVAKNDAAPQVLSGQFADRSLSRTYQAVVWGVPVPSAGSVDAPIGRSTKDRKKMAVTGKGRPALTHYKVIEDFGVASLIECQLATGRTHQIRVHLAHLKHPVVGDSVYGGGRHGKNTRALEKFPRQALHAIGLRFLHPRSGKFRTFDSKLPKDMLKLLQELRKK